jgi:gliding motility-associated-like protein
MLDQHENRYSTELNQMIRSSILFFTTLISTTLSAQKLMINEVSQGVATDGEYVEFVVLGTPTCVTPVPTVDLRKVVIDDNNGYFGSGAGQGIADGAIRFADIPFWQAVPQGTIIVIYDNSPSSMNTSIPANDVSLTDGNCKLVLPITSNLLQKTSVSPLVTGTITYPAPSSSWIASTTWTPLGMRNAGDSFQLPTNNNGTTPYHAISWGSNMQNTAIYFSGNAGGKVFFFGNSVSNDYNSQANWQESSTVADETPGAPNSPANAAWIASLNPTCGIAANSMTVSVNVINESCSGLCDGSASVVVSNGVGPYTYSWSNGLTTTTLSNLCAGNYTVTVTGSNGCSDTKQFVVTSGLSNPTATLQSAGPFTTASPVQQLVGGTIAGGAWSSNCGTCISPTGVFNPLTAGIGTWKVCYSLGSGNCADSACTLISVTACVPQTTTENKVICPGDSTLIFGSWKKAQGSYSKTFVNLSGCDSVHTVNLTLYTVNPINEVIVLCENDSTLVFNTWYFSAQTVSRVEQTADGCKYTHTVTILEKNCTPEPEVIFIPNVFSPNGDQINDTFEIIAQGGGVEQAFILNRWGNLVYTIPATTLKWDGTDEHSGLPVSDGVYTYIVYFKPKSSPVQVYNGFITVLR